MNVLNLVGAATKVAKVADGFTESAEERQQTLTTRHEKDMNSDNWLSKSIRPLVLLILMALQCFVVVASAFDLHVDSMIVGQLGTLLLGAFGFYFSSRKAEKVAAQNAKANIQLERIKNRQTRKEIRADRRAARRAERQQDKEG